MTLESRLEHVNRDVQFAPAPDFAGRIGHQLPPAVPLHHRRRTVLLIAAVIVLLLGFVLAVPQARTTVANWLHAGGIHLEIVDRFADDNEVDIDDRLILGDATTLNEATRQAGLPLFQLADTDPVRVFLRQDGGTIIVSQIYGPSDALPEIGGTGVGGLLMQVAATGDFTALTKQALPRTGFDIVEFNDDAVGFWIASGNLVAVPFDPHGTFRLDHVSRQTGNVLIWERGGVGFRLETALPKDEAITLAERLAPVVIDSGNQSGNATVVEVNTVLAIWLSKENLQ
jgi:hypothetical protein